MANRMGTVLDGDHRLAQMLSSLPYLRELAETFDRLARNVDMAVVELTFDDLTLLGF